MVHLSYLPLLLYKKKCRFSWCLIDMTTKSNTMDHFLLLRLMLLLIYCYTDYYTRVSLFLICLYMLISMHKRVYLLFVSSRSTSLKLTILGLEGDKTDAKNHFNGLCESYILGLLANVWEELLHLHDEKEMQYMNT